MFGLQKGKPELMGIRRGFSPGIGGPRWRLILSERDTGKFAVNTTMKPRHKMGKLAVFELIMYSSVLVLDIN